MRRSTKERRASIKCVTDELNQLKNQIDGLKSKIDRKENERKLRYQHDQLRAEDDFAEAAEEIIDEEELVLLRQMKDLKKVYRDQFGELKSLKQDLEEGQSQIDVVKEQLLTRFEDWYQITFEASGLGIGANTMVEEGTAADVDLL